MNQWIQRLESRALLSAAIDPVVAQALPVLSEVHGTDDPDVMVLVHVDGVTENVVVVNDVPVARAGNELVLKGGDGNDLIINQTAQNAEFQGEGGKDTLVGGPGKDTLSGGASDDLIDGGDGDDSLIGGTGADTIRGGNGNDVIRTGLDGVPDTGNVVDGGDGTDALFDGADQATNIESNGQIPPVVPPVTPVTTPFIVTGSRRGDIIVVYQARHQVLMNGRVYGSFAAGQPITINGGPGNDIITTVGKGSKVTANGGAGNDVFKGTFYAANGGAGNDVFNGTFTTAIGGTGDDVFKGTFATANGGAGWDVLVGRARKHPGINYIR